MLDQKGVLPFEATVRWLVMRVEVVQLGCAALMGLNRPRPMFLTGRAVRDLNDSMGVMPSEVLTPNKLGRKMLAMASSTRRKKVPMSNATCWMN